MARRVSLLNPSLAVNQPLAYKQVGVTTVVEAAQHKRGTKSSFFFMKNGDVGHMLVARK